MHNFLREAAHRKRTWSHNLGERTN